MTKWMVKEFMPIIPNAYVWAVVSEDDKSKAICLAPSKKLAELVAYERNRNKATFYRLTEDDMQSAAKQRLGRLLTPEELKKACESGSSLELDWMDWLDTILSYEDLDEDCRCIHCTLDKDAKCDSDDRTDCDCLPCKHCSLHPYKEVKS